jgi:hypothetical protein
MSVTISIATIKKMPVVLSEVDVLKSILSFLVLPCWRRCFGFNVRVVAQDQNLIF